MSAVERTNSRRRTYPASPPANLSAASSTSDFTISGRSSSPFIRSKLVRTESPVAIKKGSSTVFVVQKQNFQSSPLDGDVWSKVAEQYALGRTLAIGTYGRIRLAEHIATGTQVAIKMLCRKKLARAGREAIRLAVREVEILQKIPPHPNVTRLFQIFRSRKAIFLVLELAAGGELYDLVMKRGKMSESETALIMWQLLKGLKHCHGVGIVHRDIKPENLLIDSSLGKDSRRKESAIGSNIKIADFGLAADLAKLSSQKLDFRTAGRSSDCLLDFDRKSSSNTERDHDLGDLDPHTRDSFHEVVDIEALMSSQLLITTCGSPSYVAPEVLSGKKYIGPPVDMWSCGIVMYVLLCGRLPFEDDTLVGLYSKIRSGEFKIPNHVSGEAAQLLQSFLKTDPTERCSVNHALKHDFFKKWAEEFLPNLYSLSPKGEEVKFIASPPLPKKQDCLDDEVLSCLRSRGFDVETVRQSVLQRKFDSFHATYSFLKKNFADSIRKFLDRNPPVELARVANIRHCNITADVKCTEQILSKSIVDLKTTGKSSSTEEKSAEKSKCKGLWLFLPVLNKNWNSRNKSMKN